MADICCHGDRSPNRHLVNLEEGARPTLPSHYGSRASPSTVRTVTMYV
jgi:hypothetical protein